MISREKIAEIVKEVCGDDISEYTDLFDESRMDSYALIHIISGLAEEGIEIEPTAVDISCFSTLHGIIGLAEKYDNR